MVFYHPKYYKELRKRNKLDQAISPGTEGSALPRRAPGPGLKLQASSSKQQAASSKQTRTSSGSSFKRQAASVPTRVTSVKLQATSCKLRDA